MRRIACLLLLTCAACASGAAGTADPDATTPDAAAIADTSTTDSTLTDLAAGADHGSAADTAGPDLPDATSPTDAASDGDVPAPTDAAIVDAAPVDGGPPDAASCLPKGYGDLPAGFCFVGAPPKPDAFVADVPIPDPGQCPPGPPLFYSGKKVPEPTLQLELGTLIDKNFVPLQDGHWLPIVHGPQGGIHVILSFRVTLPGHDEPKVTVQTQLTGWAGCLLLASGPEQVVLVQTTDPEPVYTSAKPSDPGIWLIFPVSGAESAQYCGQWYDLRLQVRDAQHDTWGEARKFVRLYDTFTQPGCVPQ